MELREYIRIFVREKYYFLVPLILIVSAAFIWNYNRPETYTTVLSLHTARVNNEPIDTTTEYNYESFYRLQADERFSDTLVRWLGSPRIVFDIYEGAGVDIAEDYKLLSKKITAKRLSSQYVEVRYTTTNPKDATHIARSMDVILNEKTTNLNLGVEAGAWFKVLVDDPITSRDIIPSGKLFLIAILLGSFLGVFSALFRHYMRDGKVESDKTLKERRKAKNEKMLK